MSEIALTEPHPPPSYADRFVCTAAAGCPPVVCRSGLTGSSATLLTPPIPPMSDEPWSEYQAYAVPLSMSAAVSTLCSPAQSARGAKRRVMSSSTFSSDVPSDIISMIRYSPTEISLFGGSVASGRPTSSSSELGHLCSGSISHLSARNSVSAAARAQRQQLSTTLDELDNPLAAVIAMYNLEDQGSPGLDHHASNQVVNRQNDNFIRCAAAECCQQSAPAEFPGEIPSSQQNSVNLDDIDELEYFLQISAAVDDADHGGQRAPPYGNTVSGVVGSANNSPNPTSDGAATIATGSDIFANGN